MRTKNAIINGTIGMMSQILVMGISFVTRKLFLVYLGTEMLGLNGVFTDIFNLLNLAELGIGTIITYYLYKPITENDEEQISALIHLYKKIFGFIGAVIAVSGFILMFFIPLLIKGVVQDLQFLRTIYILQLMSTVATYFFAHKRTLIYAYQKEYIVSIMDTVSSIVCNILQILILILYRNYILYLALHVLKVIFSNYIIARRCSKMYPFINKKVNYKNYNFEIYKKLKEVIVNKLSSYVYGSTDNIIIATFLGVTQVGLLSNYVLISNSISGLIIRLTYPVAAGIGDVLSQKNTDEKAIEILNTYLFITYSITSFALTCMVVLIQPIIILWLGSKYLLSMITVMLIAFQLFFTLLQQPLCQYINGCGLFRQDKYVSLAGTITNLILSIILVKYQGMNGVLWGTLISSMIFIVGRSYIVFKVYFGKLLKQYCFNMLGYISAFLIQVVLTYYISHLVISNTNIYTFIYQAMICILIPNIVNIILFSKTKQYKHMKELIANVFLNNRVSRRV